MVEVRARQASGQEDRLIAAPGSVISLVAWTSSDGHIILASAGADGTIRRWDATVGLPIGDPITSDPISPGFLGTVQTLAAWTGPDGHTMLASGHSAAANDARVTDRSCKARYASRRCELGSVGTHCSPTHSSKPSSNRTAIAG